MLGMVGLGTWLATAPMGMAGEQVGGERKFLPDGFSSPLGVHFLTIADPKDIDLVKDAGFSFVRQMMYWPSVEKEKGVYDFTAFDKRMDELKARGLGAMFILCFSHRKYLEEPYPGNNTSLVPMNTDALRQAYANYAAAAVAHYRDRGDNQRIVYELWNEPSIEWFWKPKPNPDEYMSLLKVAVPAIRKADPNAVITSMSVCFDNMGKEPTLNYFEECLRQGGADLLDGITVHPYARDPAKMDPETNEEVWLRMNALVARYRPKNPPPLINSEEGWHRKFVKNDDKWAWYPARQLMLDLRMGVPMTTAFVYRSKKGDLTTGGDGFDFVNHEFEPQRPYYSLQKMMSELKGLSFRKCLGTDETDLSYLFSDGKRSVVAAFTRGAPHAATVLGQPVQLTGEPQYLPVPADNPAALAQTAWYAKARTLAVGASGEHAENLPAVVTVTVRNPFPRSVPVKVEMVEKPGLDGAFAGPTTFDLAPNAEKQITWTGRPLRHDVEFLGATVAVSVDGTRDLQRLRFVLADPIRITTMPLAGHGTGLCITAGPKSSINGTLTVWAGDETKPVAVGELRMGASAKEPYSLTIGGAVIKGQRLPDKETVVFPLPETIRAGQTLRVKLSESNGPSTLVRIESIPFDAENITPVAKLTKGEGNPEVTFVPAPVLEGMPLAAMRVAYSAPAKSDMNVKFGSKPRTIASPAATLNYWVKGDATSNGLLFRFFAKNGMRDQRTRISFAGWKLISHDLGGSRGDLPVDPNTPRVVGPVDIRDFLLNFIIPPPGKNPTGEILLGGVTVVHQESETKE